MKVKIFVELVGGVVLVSGQELTKKTADDVNRLCCHVEDRQERWPKQAKLQSWTS